MSNILKLLKEKFLGESEENKKEKMTEFKKKTRENIFNHFRNTQYFEHKSLMKEIIYLLHYTFLVLEDDYYKGDKLFLKGIPNLDDYIFSSYKNNPDLRENIKKLNVISFSNRFEEEPKENFLSYFVFIEEMGLMAFNKKDKEIKENQYIYEGKDKKGKIVKGEMRAASDSVVKVALRSKGIQIIKIKKQKFSKEKPIKMEDVSVFTRQLATMMKAGVPLLQSFDIVANGHSNASVSKLLYDIKNSVETGSSMAQAFGRHPKYFDSLFCNLVEAGEKAGILDMILDRLASYQEKMLYIKGKIKSALTYPIAVMGIAIIVTAILMIFVVPVFGEVFKSFGAELPAPTQIVMNISDFFVHNWFFLFGGMAGLIIGLKKAIETNQNVRNGFERLLLKLPIFGPIITKAIVARWARTLATMFAAGVPLVEALNSVAGASGNVVYYNATKEIQKNVSTGQSLTVSMQNEHVFPNMMIQMSQIGEESGSLDDMLNKVAEFYENEVDEAVSSLSSLMEPLIIGFLGVVVGGLVVAMYLPIFKMAGAV